MEKEVEAGARVLKYVNEAMDGAGVGEIVKNEYGDWTVNPAARVKELIYRHRALNLERDALGQQLLDVQQDCVKGITTSALSIDNQ